MPGRILGLYALSVMEVEGTLYGYMLAERIADRTDGAWRPAAGAVYPALESLTRRKLARTSIQGRRRIYWITSEGRSVLREVRRNMAWRARGGPDLSRLWSEIAGPEHPGQFLLDSFRRRLDGIVNFLSREGPEDRRQRQLRNRLEAELQLALDRLRSADPRVGKARKLSRVREEAA